MSQDTIDLLKAMVVIVLVFALSTLVMLYLLFAYRTFGGNLPVIGSLPSYEPPAAIPLLVDVRWLVVLGATFLTGSGLTLILTSQTMDMAMLIFAKAMTLIITAAFGIFGGIWLYMRLSAGSELSLASLNRLAIALVIFFVLASVLRLSSLRASGALRFAIAAGLILLGPIVLVSL